jgi:lipoprotein-releasing system permease protein
MIKNTNLEIAITHVVTRRKQTVVAALGVLIGVGIYLFMNSLSSGFTKFSRDEIFKNSAQIKIYKDDEVSQALKSPNQTAKSETFIVNPQIVASSKQIVNPIALLNAVKKESYVRNAIVQVDFNAFYNKGAAEIKGTGNGVNMIEYSAMFNTVKYMVAGSIHNLQSNLNGVIIGSGIAKKLSLGLDDNITMSSSYGVQKNLKIVGIFETGNSMIDNSKSYVNISTAQQFVKQGSSYVSNIYINTFDANHSAEYAKQLQQITAYKVEDWTVSNADLLAGDVTRSSMMRAIAMSILLVASFGIYNILSATISQKINDIAILKATGFTGNDVVKIFVTEAMIMGLIGTVVGLIFGGILIGIMQNVYMGGPVGYFPIHFEWQLFLQSFILGQIITFCAGYFPAKKAANVDPVSIFRK